MLWSLKMHVLFSFLLFFHHWLCVLFHVDHLEHHFVTKSCLLWEIYSFLVNLSKKGYVFMHHNIFLLQYFPCKNSGFYLFLKNNSGFRLCLKNNSGFCLSMKNNDGFCILMKNNSGVCIFLKNKFWLLHFLKNNFGFLFG